MKPTVSPFLTFNGQAKEAMDFYAQTIPNTQVIRAMTYGELNPETPQNATDLIMQGAFAVAGTEILCLDMVPDYAAPDFAWSNSLLVRFNHEADFHACHNGLAEGGSVMMGPEKVGDITLCSWVVDKYGVVWQPVLDFAF